MNESFKMLKNWWAFARPNKKYFAISLISAMIHRTFIVIAPIFAAKVITALTVSNYSSAIMYLLVGLGLYTLRCISIHFKYMVHSKLLEGTFYPLQKKFADKIFVADHKNFKGDSIDKIMNIFHGDIYNVANMADILASRISYLWQVLITLVSIAVISYEVALIVSFMIIINFMILTKLQRKYAYGTKKIREATDLQYSTFSKLLNSKDYAQSDKIKNKLEKEFLDSNKVYVKEFHKRQPWSSAVGVWYYLWCELFVCVVTIFMVIMVSKNTLNLELYLIVVPYITSAISVSNDFLAVFTDLRNANVYINRIKVVLNFSERDFVKFGNNNYDDVLGQIDFIDLYYKKKNKDDLTPNLNDVNFHVKEGDTVLLLGARNSGKHAVFDMLLGSVKPTKGKIYIDGLEMNEYSKKAYLKNVSYCSSKPHFYGGSIMKELSLIDSKKDNIYDVCKKVGIYDDIMATKSGFNSSPDMLSVKNRFLLGFARCLLSSANIIMIYELPSTINEKDYNDILDVLSTFNGKTLLIFSAMENISKISDKIVEFENGTVKNITFNKKGENNV